MAASQVEWKCLVSEDLIAKNNSLARTETRDHPLKALVVTERIPRRILGSQPSTGRTTPTVSTPSALLEPLSTALEGLDPLTAFAIEEMDPLSKMAAEEDRNSSGGGGSSSSRRSSLIHQQDSKKIKDGRQVPSLPDEIEPWSSRRAAILSKFTTSEKISIVTSFLSEGEKVVVKAQSTAVDKIQHRLEQLDCFEESSQRKLDLSQAEYVTRIEQLNRELVTAWHSEQRVKSLKIAIQCAKLLSDTQNLTFYPSKFVLITDILDIFGQLVYNRLRSKADNVRTGSAASGLPENFTPEMVSDSAKETCLNWFYKIASIRELVPRLYLEMALVKSYAFLSATESQEALTRLSHMICGIGNPLVAVYARCYLCRAGLGLQQGGPKISKQYLQTNFHQFLNSYHHLFSRSVKADLLSQKVTMSVYMTLFTPALDFILEPIAHDAPDSFLNVLLERCKSQKNSSLILNTIMSAFKPSAVSLRALQFLEMIEKCSSDSKIQDGGTGKIQDGGGGIPQHLLLRTLGLCLSVSAPLMEHRRQILNFAWKRITTGLGCVHEYILAAEAWAPYVVQCFSYREINTMLGDIISHLTPERSYELHYNSLKNVLDRILMNVQDFETLLAMDNFLPFIDLFQEESVHVEACKKILSAQCGATKIAQQSENFAKRKSSATTTVSDPVVVNALMFLCTILHDSLSALTPEDEHRQVGEILCQIIKMVDYGRDFEQQLSFYVEARGVFSNVDAVFVQLVQCVNCLSIKTRQIVKGVHTRKTADFVRACAAYCFITIPSIRSVKLRLDLYLLSGQVALFNQCLGQADACFKAALNTISELTQEKNSSGNVAIQTQTQKNQNHFSDAELVNFTKKFLAVLLVVPDNPECAGVLHLTRNLLNVLQAYQWESRNSLNSIYLSVIDMLSSMSQESYPYHVDKVESNDALYGSDPKFLMEINKICSVIVREIISFLTSRTKESADYLKQEQSHTAKELFIRLALRADLNGNQQMLNLALNLWNLAARCEKVEFKKQMARTRSYLKRRSYTLDNAALQELVEQLPT